MGGVRAISDDGEYVFFDSKGALVSGASNHTLDVYQWHENPATHVRSVSLVGSGADSAPTFFLGYSPNPFAPTLQAREAGNVFIGTHATLAPQDTNSIGDIYDARICELGSPCIASPEGETAQCAGGSCQTPPAAPPDPTASLLAPPPAATVTPPPPKKETAAQIRAKHLAAAMKVCKKDKSKKKRAACDRAAHKRYGPLKAAKKSSTARRATSNRRAGP